MFGHATPVELAGLRAAVRILRLFQSIKAEITDMRIVDKEIEGMPIKSSVSAVTQMAVELAAQLRKWCNTSEK